MTAFPQYTLDAALDLTPTQVEALGNGSKKINHRRKGIVNYSPGASIPFGRVKKLGADKK
jgi:hypothetical protein